MPVRSVYVYGAGGHGKVVADVLRAQACPPVGFVDDERPRSTIFDLPVLGVGEWLATTMNREEVGVALGIGDNWSRKRIADRCRDYGFQIVTALHPSAVFSPTSMIGEGTVVMPLAMLNTDSIVGLGVIVNSGALIEHDCIIGDYAHVSPNVSLGGRVHIGSFCLLGLGAVVLPGITVGSGSIVGAGAVVVSDIPERVIAVGVPARISARIKKASETATVSAHT
jgi:sugar O-acyltransferase (sialic acid O-acetyltransferase NeuD family)